MSRVLLSMVVALFVAIGTASAQDAEKKKDGPKKPKKTVEEIFKAKDANNDGKLTFDELKGKIKKAEAIEKLERRFKAKDKDGDKALSLEEFKARPKKAKKPGEKKEKKPGEKKGKKPEGKKKPGGEK